MQWRTVNSLEMAMGSLLKKHLHMDFLHIFQGIHQIFTTFSQQILPRNRHLNRISTVVACWFRAARCKAVELLAILASQNQGWGVVI
jgi:hypothetical protein